jgi:hypothetical protein
MLLCLPLFDDGALRSVFPRRLTGLLQRRIRIVRPHRVRSYVVSAVAVVIVFCSLVEMDLRFGGRLPTPALAVDEFIGPLHIVSSYGLFAVMTKQRNEIVIEGSDDDINWREYDFRYKPGDVQRALSWNIPHQPRLDWQMWFAALGAHLSNACFERLLERLREGSPEVLALLAKNPFQDEPPRYVRGVLYDYRFTTRAERSESGAWWQRERRGLYKV